MLIVAPSAGKIHRYPFDCWRFYPDAGLALASYAHCDLDDSGILDEDFPKVGASLWRDWYVVLKKPLYDSGSDEIMRQILRSHNHDTVLPTENKERFGPLSKHLVEFSKR